MLPVVKRNCRRYGGALQVLEPFPTGFEFQIADIHVVNDVPSVQEYDTDFFTTSKFQHHLKEQEIFESEPDYTKPSEAVLFGRTEQGFSVAVRVPYRPYVFAEIPYALMNNIQQNLALVKEQLCRLLNVDEKDIGMEVLKRHKLFGWVSDPSDVTKRRMFNVVRISVPNVLCYGRLNNVLRSPIRSDFLPGGSVLLRPMETKVDHSHKFCDALSIVASGWVRVNKYTGPPGYISHAQIECCVNGEDLTPLDRADLAPLLVASVDIETYSRRYQFPDARQTEDFVITIGTTLWRVGDKVEVQKTDAELRTERKLHRAQLQEDYEARKSKATPLEVQEYVNEQMLNFKPALSHKVCRTERFVFCLMDTDPVPNATVFSFNTETELLEAWRDFMTVHADPDLVIGHNVLGFDWKYMNDRVKREWQYFPSEQERVDRPLFVADDVVDKELQVEEERWLQDLRAAEEGLDVVKVVDDDKDIDDVDDLNYDKPTTAAAAATGADNGEEDSDDHEDGHFDSDLIDTTNNGIEEDVDTRFFYLTRIWSRSCACEEAQFSSSAYGDRKNYHYHMTGRATIDLLQLVRREHKLDSYKLDFIAKKFLRDCKVDLPYKLMFKYFERGPQRRALIADYCLKDCDLPVRLLDFLSAVPNLVGMSRITYTQMTQILERGQQIKVFNQLVWYAHRMGYVLNNPPEQQKGKFAGATVVEPDKGWYPVPICTLDYASLYPSIIRDQNLCFSTIILNHNDVLVRRIPPDMINKIKVNDTEHWFVNHTKGVLPALEENLLKARKDVKKQMKTAEGDLYKMLDGKQLAIKVSCNSVFGFCGADKGMYSCKAIAESITARGRVMIDKTKKMVEERYPGSKVIYGDTDSVFIKFNVTADSAGVFEAFRLGTEAAALVSSQFSDAVGLEMEKVYFPYLLFGKKRYAGMKYEKPERPSYIDTKGIEVVRRDSSLLTRKISQKVLNCIFYDNDPEGAVALLQNEMQKMIDNRQPFEWYVMSKSLKSHYANPDSQAHVAVVRKIRERAPGSEPQVGDRVPFVVVQCHKNAKRLSEKTEDPAYVQKNNVPLDMEYYIEKQLKQPLLKLFKPFVDDPKDIFTTALAAANRKRNRQRTLDDMMGDGGTILRRKKPMKPKQPTTAVVEETPAAPATTPQAPGSPATTHVTHPTPPSTSPKQIKQTHEVQQLVKRQTKPQTTGTKSKKTGPKSKKAPDTKGMRSLDSYLK